MNYSNTKSLFFFGIVLLLAFTSCKGTRQAAGKPLKERSAKYISKRIDQNKVDVNWLSGKGKIYFKGNGQSIRGTFTIRMKKDSVIWMNVKKFGIEGARMLITRDSVYAINRLEKSYIAKDISFVQQEYNLPADFQALQEVLLGNAIMVDNELDVAIDELQYHLEDKDAELQRAYWFDGYDFRLHRMVFEEPRQARKVSVEQKEFKQVNEKINFSYFRQLNIDSPDSGEVTVELTYTDVEVNVPKTIKFDIPSRYRYIP